MFFLVAFSDGTSGIYPIKDVTMLSGKSCLVKHKGTKYEASLLNMHETKQYLEDILNTSTQIDLSTPNTTVELSNCNLGDVSVGVEYVDINRRSNSIVNSFNENEMYRSLNEHETHQGFMETGNQKLIETVTTCSKEDVLVDRMDNSLHECVNNEITDVCLLEPIASANSCVKDKTDYQENITISPIYGGSLGELPESDLDEQTEFQDDSLGDPDFVPDTDIVNRDYNDSPDSSGVNDRDLILSDSIDSPTENRVNGESSSSTLLSWVDRPVDDRDLHVQESRGRKGDKKFNFCIYCHTKQQKISRHLETRHGEEQDVKAFLRLPSGNPLRREMIGDIRKKGNFLYNTNQEYNDGTLIVSRRPNRNAYRTANDYMPCANCRAFFSKATLKIHFRACSGESSTTTRSVKLLSKRLAGRIHPVASEIVREYLFPPLRDDVVTAAIRYDELIIIVANKMCEKYRDSRHYDMIRQRLRLLGRFLILIKDVNSIISDLASVYDAKFLDVLKSMNLVAKFSASTSTYATPSVAFSLSTLIKQSGNILITESIKKHDDDRKKRVKDFLKIFTQEVNININRTVAESQNRMRRQKRVELPSMEDIKKFRDYLLKERRKVLSEIEQIFSFEKWMQLAEFTLVSIQLFNRRRAGELERMLIADFKNAHAIDEHTNKDLYMSLSKKNKEIAKRYARIEIRGKLNRTVPVLMDSEIMKCIDIVIQNRSASGVRSDNPYVFGLPGDFKIPHLRACNLMRRFSEQCGADHPERLRGTQLRKHIATTCITLNLQEHEVTDLANFLGHQEKIHKEIYRQPVLSREIIQISKLLEIVQGADEKESDDDTEDIENIDNMEPSASQPQQELHSKKQVQRLTTLRFVTPGTKRRTQSYGSVRRTRWTAEEKKTVVTVFKKHISNQRYPSLQEIQEAIKEYPILQNRTPPQIKTWLSNQYKSKKRLSFL